MAKIFISYRREDSQYAVDRIYEALRRRLKKRDIFMDVDDIPKGVDFVEYLSAKVAQCETLVAVIGPQWLTVTDKDGSRRLNNPEDFVRIEIVAALKRGIPVVPVLLDGTPMPTAAQLPQDMRGFERRNGAEVHRRTLKSDIEALVRDLGYAGGGAGAGLYPVLATLAVIGGGGAAAYFGGMFSPSGPPPVVEQTAEVGRASARQPDLEAETDGGPRPALLGDETPDTTAADAAARSEAIGALQRALSGIGLYTSGIDGAVGPGTRAAAARFASETNAPAMDLETATPADIAALTARVEAEAIRRAERESAAWSIAQRTDTIAAYRAYLADYPSGANVSAANSRIRALEREAAVQAPPANTDGGPGPPLRPGDTFRDCDDCPEMVVLPAGSFVMGSPAGEEGRDSDEGPLRTVQIGYQFAVGKYEVTWAQWEACVADGGCDNAGPLGAGGDNGWGRGNRPVINVSWNDAEAYAQWLSRTTGERYRLLSEAEWEYAARGVTTPTAASTRFSWGDGDPVCTRGARNGAVFRPCEGRGTEPVGFSAANAFGLHDMHGNVWEWTQDCYVDSYSGAPTDGSARIVSECSRRVLRGGSWNGYPQNLRSADRNWLNPTYRVNYIGFRVARTLSPPTP